MIKKKILGSNRIRRINGGFSFIPHRFLTEGFLASLGQKEFLLYLFLTLAADRYGLSFYSYDRICSLLQLSVEQYITARNGLIKMMKETYKKYSSWSTIKMWISYYAIHSQPKIF